MILVDMNQVMISNMMAHLVGKEINIKLIRHMVLNSLRYNRSKFYEKYGELVLCYDSKHYWRKEYFKYYKGTRKKDRENSELDWSEIFKILNQIRDEIRDHLPYKVVEVDGAEADDCIAVLCKDQGLKNIRLHNNMQPIVKVLILSGDKDFIQLQKYKFVNQYNPIQKKFINGSDPKQYVLEHIMKGDRSDGIPNYLSDDDTFVNEKRQRPLSKKNIIKYTDLSPEEFCSSEQQLKNYERNKTLIDFECIPTQIVDAIIDTYEMANPPKRSAIYPYLMQHNLKDLLEKIGEF
jgi:5'-3' exonuclease